MSIPEKIGRYRILHKLGEGGMGIVYAADDDRLERTVALKLIGAVRDEQSRARLWREARLAASVSHPNVCAVYEVGEEEGELFIAMELLKGEPLGSRLSRGGLGAEEAVKTMLEVLAALEALHDAGLVHRDIKPSNVFLTPHGVKLVDFGIARPIAAAGVEAEVTRSLLTEPGSVVGTPHYMSPEQLRGEAVDARSDLFAAGALLYEMVAGRHAFEGRSRIDVMHATLYDDPPALSGSPLAERIGRVVRRALAKRAEDRLASAAVMAKELRDALLDTDARSAAASRSMTRLIVLPFRVLRPDPETDFLAFSLPDAVASSLAAIGSLVVRSSLAAARFAGEIPDLKRIAAEADVDLVLAGTLLRAGEQIRVQCQLTELPAGALLWSRAAQAALGDVFRLEEELVSRIVESISLPLTAREHGALKRDVPASARAYELYLRANQIGQGVNAVEGPKTHLPIARDLYLQCLEEDPRYAPAWARLGRCYRLLAKTGEEAEQNFDRAEAAFARALELNPDLPATHVLYALLETDRGRSREALRRLLRRAASFPNDPELFTGLVQVCRYCGLLDASIAAHTRAKRLDRNAATSVAHTLWLRGDHESALEAGGVNPMQRATVLATMGRQDDALRAVPPITPEMQPLTVLFWTSFRAALTGVTNEGREAAIRRVRPLRDPEARFHTLRHLARMGEVDLALTELAGVVDAGYVCPDFMERDPWLESLRPRPAFDELLVHSRALLRTSEALFLAEGGDRILASHGEAPTRAEASR